MVIFLSSASSLCSSLTSSGFANFVYGCYSLIYNVLRRSRTATRFLSRLLVRTKREREEKSSRLRASAFFNRRHIRRVHRRAKKLNLSYFCLRRVALIRLHEQRDRSDVFEQRLRCSEEKERNGQYRDASAYRYTQEYASYSNKKAQTRKREESTTTTLIKADKNKTKPSASLLSRVYARSSSNLTWSNSIAFPSLNMHSFSSNKSFCVAFFVEQSSNW